MPRVGVQMDGLCTSDADHKNKSESREQPHFPITSSKTTRSRVVSDGVRTRSSPAGPIETGQAHTGALVPLSRSSETNVLKSRRDPSNTASQNTAAADPSAFGPGGQRPFNRFSTRFS